MRKKLWCLTLNLPLPGTIPPRVNMQLMNRLMFEPAMALVSRLGDRYYAAGCPAELCDTAAARDIWLHLHADQI